MDLVAIYASEACLTVVMGTIPALFPVFCKQALDVGVKEFGLLEAVVSLGGICGGVFVPFFAARIGFEKVFFVLLVFLAVATIGFGHIPFFPLALGLYGIIGICLTAWALIFTYAQLNTDLQYQGRVQALASGVSGGIILCFYIGSQFSENRMSVSAIYILEASITLLSLVFFSAGVFLKGKYQAELDSSI